MHRPWRPRELEALLSRFNLLVDSGLNTQPEAGAGLSPGGTSSASSSVLSYEGFLSFWDDSGLKDMLEEVRESVGRLPCITA